MLDGFFGNKWAIQKTDKQKLELRIKDSVLNLILDRDQSFLKTARANNTSIIVNNRDGGIQEFYHENRKFISFPSSMENELAELDEFEAEEKMDTLIKLATCDVGSCDEEDMMNAMLDDKLFTYKDFTGLDSGFEIEKDAVTDEITNNPFEYRAGKSEKDDEDDAEEGEDGSAGSKSLSSKGMEENSSSEHQNIPLTEGNREEREYSFEDTDLDIGGSIPQELKDNAFYGNQYNEPMSNHREQKLRALANQIVKSFKGRVSKQKTMIPSKRLVSKALCRDDIDKIYSNKHGNDGKNLNINLIFDMSGSMSGTPVENAIEMAYIFNEIAAQGHLSGNIIYSESSSRCKVTFPMPREFIKGMGRTGGAEGLGRNMQHYKKELKEADTNICMTDGQLCDDPILKQMYAKEKIEVIGVYVNEDAKDLTEYTGSLERWFTRSLVRNTTEELCEKLVQFSLRKKK